MHYLSGASQPLKNEAACKNSLMASYLEEDLVVGKNLKFFIIPCTKQFLTFCPPANRPIATVCSISPCKFYKEAVSNNMHKAYERFRGEF